MEFLIEYGMFLAKAVTFVFCALIIFGNLLPFGKGGDDEQKGKLSISKINERYENAVEEIKDLILSKQEKKAAKQKAKKEAKDEAKKQKIQAKEKTKQQATKVVIDENAIESSEAAAASTETTKKVEADLESKGRVFYLHFNGDVQAKAASNLREEITAVLSVAKENDEVVVNIESPGGVVHGYGFAASQLDRVRKAGIKLTAVVDKVAASGGYMMACVADHIHAAPFSIIGSVGVVAQMPNFHRLLEKHDVDVELHTAGEHKRTLTMFGENTDEGRQKFREDLEDVHVLFKDFISDHRPNLDVEKIATGEIWFGTKALEVGLVDTIGTSDEYLLSKIKDHDVFEVKFEPKKTLQERLSGGAESTIQAVISSFISKLRLDRYFS